VQDLAQRLAYLDLDDEDLALLGRLRPLLEQHADDFVEAFYRHLLAFPSVSQFLRDPKVRKGLLQQQRAYLLSLAGPKIDADYVRNRRSIGAVHERLGVAPRWYLGAYALYLSLLTPLVCELFEDDLVTAKRTLVALQKLLLLDVQLAMETYISKHESELERLNEELAQSGRRMARDLEDRRDELRETRARASAAEQLASVATLVAGLAHEIGTPMGVIQGHAKMLESDVRGDEARWRLETIQEQITRISGIIHALLNMARPSRSAYVPVDLAATLQTTLAFVSEKLARRQIRVERHFDEVPSVLGDPERLQQVFLNLAVNAADAMPRGGVFRVELAELEPGWVDVTLADTGAGIPIEEIGRVFEPFFTTKPAGQGSGLGLAVTRGIVIDHGGTIDVRSRAGEGTEFHIRLPVQGSPEPSEPGS
jgi:signal transduction histidine kinase